jgi:hypothetical protein
MARGRKAANSTGPTDAKKTNFLAAGSKRSNRAHRCLARLRSASGDGSVEPALGCWWACVATLPTLGNPHP